MIAFWYSLLVNALLRIDSPNPLRLPSDSIFFYSGYLYLVYIMFVMIETFVYYFLSVSILSICLKIRSEN